MFITAEKLQKPVQATITLRSKDVHILCLRVFFVFVFCFCFCFVFVFLRGEITRTTIKTLQGKYSRGICEAFEFGSSKKKKNLL